MPPSSILALASSCGMADIYTEPDGAPPWGPLRRAEPYLRVAPQVMRRGRCNLPLRRDTWRQETCKQTALLSKRRPARGIKITFAPWGLYKVLFNTFKSFLRAFFKKALLPLLSNFQAAPSPAASRCANARATPQTVYL